MTQIEKENERLRLRVAELERRLGTEVEPQTATDAKADRNLRIGMAIAKQVFKKRGKGRKYPNSEAHIGQTELAGICALAAEYGARGKPQADPIFEQLFAALAGLTDAASGLVGADEEGGDAAQTLNPYIERARAILGKALSASR